MRIRPRQKAEWIALLGILMAILLAPAQSSGQNGETRPTPVAGNHRQFLDRYCVSCHSERLKSGDLSLASADPASPAAVPELWEKVARKLRTGVMPPPTAAQPSDADRQAILTWLESSLDTAAASKPNPGRTDTLRR